MVDRKHVYDVSNPSERTSGGRRVVGMLTYLGLVFLAAILSFVTARTVSEALFGVAYSTTVRDGRHIIEWVAGPGSEATNIDQE